MRRKITQRQILLDLKSILDGEVGDLNSAITKAIDDSPCDYTEVIGILDRQKKFMLMAQRQEHMGLDPTP